MDEKTLSERTREDQLTSRTTSKAAASKKRALSAIVVLAQGTGTRANTKAAMRCFAFRARRHPERLLRASAPGSPARSH
jgi:hypothetical protein